MKEKNVVSIKIKSAIRAGYRPVHGWVYPDSYGQWMKGWFDLDSIGTLGAAEGGEVPPPPPG
jgi:hypothetical protein